MLYEVRRTSSFTKKPCKEAVKRACIRRDYRTTDDPAKIPSYSKNPAHWYSEGRNHRVENGQIVREFDSEAWFVNIDTLEQLMKFQAKYGSLVISTSWWHYDENGKVYPSIEIYDDYRE